MASRAARWIGTVLTTLLVVGAAAYPFFSSPPAEPEPEPGPTMVQPGASYYVLLSSIEVEPRQEDGDGWDPNDGAPDLLYSVLWRDTQVFESSRKDDTLLAVWSNSEIGLKDLTGAISIDDSIKAARVMVREGEDLVFTIYDQDDLTANDTVGRWTVPLTALQEGEQVWTEPAKGIVSVTCRVLRIGDVDFGTLTR